MSALRDFNLRDKGAEIWAGWNRPVRTIFVITVVVLVGLLPFAPSWGPTSFLNTPITSFENVLVYPVGMFVLMALGLNIVVGKSGLLDLGYIAFFAIGAYTHAILGTFYGLNLWINIILGAAFAMVAGVILGLPALRLRGDYLAIITLGFGEIVRIVALNLEFTGGAAGIAGIPAAACRRAAAPVGARLEFCGRTGTGAHAALCPQAGQLGPPVGACLPGAVGAEHARRRHL